MERIYNQLINWHFHDDGLMLFLAGPRQSGKTTVSQQAAKNLDNHLYLNWDNKDHRAQILAGPTEIANAAKLQYLNDKKAYIIFDELHKYADWKNFLKGFYDSYKDLTQIIVTGSSRLDIFKKGGDSLMGRYFLYRMHPVSVAETQRTQIPTQAISKPLPTLEEDYQALYQFGGYPKPFLRRDKAFTNRWQRLRLEQLIQEDIRDGTRIQELKQLEILVDILKMQGAKQLSYSKLAKRIGISVDTITRWINVLSSFYYCFKVKPWHHNIARALTKEPKLFLWDWSLIQDEGARFENFIASHLLKAVHFWTDIGLNDYDLHYIRTIDKKEVDFLVTKNNKPWFLVEAKYSGNQPINQNLVLFHKQLRTEHAFQVCFDLPYIQKNCFEIDSPIIVPAKTFLSQLV